ncbi:MAG: hypothetical protein JSW50_08080 [Candidatus Latescibacterota bacterium]|nr:MAG: hypothetical protein JSW50_08080 [Candidatus Latescibacterota bacterium]
MTKMIWLIPLAVLVACGCEKRDTRVTAPASNGMPDAVVEEAGITAEFFNSDNPVTADRLNDVVRRTDVESAVDWYKEKGYAVDESNSFVVNGRGPDGSPIELTIIAMGHSTRPHRDAVYLIHLDCVEGRVIVPLRIVFEKTTRESDVYQIGESVWLEWIDPPLATASAQRTNTTTKTPTAAAALAAKMSVSQWIKCVSERIAAGAVACAMVCRLAPVVYLQCMANCTTGHVTYALVACTIQAL